VAEWGHNIKVDRAFRAIAQTPYYFD